MDIAKSLKHINPKSLMIYMSSYDNYYVDMIQAEPFRFIKKDVADIETFENILKTALSDAIKRINNKALFTYEFNKIKYTIELDKVICFHSAARTIHIQGNIGESPAYFYGKIDELCGISIHAPARGATFMH